VFQRTLAAGAESRDFFGLAQGKEEARYQGFSFGQRALLCMDASLLLIEPVAAARFAEMLYLQDDAARTKAMDSTGDATDNPTRPTDPVGRVNPAVLPNTPSAAQAIKKQFYGSIELDAVQAKKQFADLVDEVVLQFTARPGVRVKIAIEIQAESATGFDDGVQRVVKENCKVLRFKNAEFENTTE
jgi:hypothetical protein